MHKKGQKTSSCQQSRVLLAAQLSSYSWLNSACSLAPAQHQGIAQGTTDGDQGHPRCRDQSLLTITAHPRGGSPLRPGAGSIPAGPAARPLHDKRDKGTRSSIYVPFGSHSLGSLIALSPRLYGRTQEKARSSDPTRSRHALCLMLCLRYLCTLPSQQDLQDPTKMREGKGSSLIAARCSIQSESTYHPVSRAPGTAGQIAIPSL